MAIGALGGQPQEQPQPQPQLQHDEAGGQHQQQTHEGHLLPPTTAALAALSMSSALSPPAAAAEGGGSEDTAALERALAGYCAVPDATAASATAMVESDAEEAGAAAGDGGDAPLLAPQQIQRQQEDAVGHLNRVLLHVQRAKRLEGVVGLMGPYLTSEEGKVRAKAATLLGELLHRLPALPLTEGSVRHYADFFAARLGDFPSLPGALLALRALLQHHGAAARQEAPTIARALFKDVHVPSTTQNVRQRAFGVLLELVSPSTSSSSSGVDEADEAEQALLRPLLGMGEEFLRGVLDCMEGEKDPRCLILCLRVLGRAQQLLPQASDALAEACFDVTACYFPITFTPPPNDPYGITPEVLSQALRSTLTARPAMAELVLPLLVDKLSSTHVPAKMEALATLQLAPRAYGLPAMRGNLPSVTAALFQEIVSCPDPAVVGQALATARTLAGYISNQPAAEADWQGVVVRGLVHRAVAEVKANPDSMMGRACAHLLAAVARASARAYTAVLQAAVPVALKLLAPPPLAPAPAPVGLEVNLGLALGPSPTAAAAQGGSESARQAALELLVDLIEAVDPSLDCTGLDGGPPLAPFVPQLHAALLECLTAPAPAPARLAVQGLASLATQSPSELLPPEQAHALVRLFTARLRAEERTVGDAYDPDLARALLQGLQTLSRRREAHTGAVLAHTLPELLGWMDEAAAAGGCLTPAAAAAAAQQAQQGMGRLQLGQRQDHASHGSSHGNNSSLELDRCLRALAVLAEQAEVFQAVVPALLTRVLLPASARHGRHGQANQQRRPPTPQLRPGDGTGHILLSLAQIFASTSAANAQTVPALLALAPPPASPRGGGGARGFSTKDNDDDDDEERRAAQKAMMEVEGEGGVARRVGDGGAPAPAPYRDSACLWSLVVAVLAAASRGERLGDAALEATLRIVAAATVALPPRLQEAFARRLLRLLVPLPPADEATAAAAAFEDMEEEGEDGGDLLPAPEPRAIERLRPLAPEAYPAQHQALSLLLTALAAVDVASPVLEAEGVTAELLPALVRLALEAPPARAASASADGAITLSLPPHATAASSSNSNSDEHPQHRPAAAAAAAAAAAPSAGAADGPGGSSVTAAALEEPACWGAALLVNKVGDEAAVQAAASALLRGFGARLRGGAVAGDGGGLQARRDVTSLAWLTKALAMRGAPRAAMEEAVALLIDVAGGGGGSTAQDGAAAPPQEQEREQAQRLALSLHAAEALGWILREGTPILAPRPGLTRVNPLWRQRLFHLAFARLRGALDAYRGGGTSGGGGGGGNEAKEARAAPPLLAICNLVAGLPRAVVQAEVTAIVAVVVQGMASAHPTLAARATETLAGLARDNVEALVPHLSTLIPLLYGLCTPASPHFLPRARLRVLALQSLLELTRLPYAKLHPHRAQVSRGLLAPLDDRKRLVRQTAVKVRNEWMVMDR